MIYDDYKWRDKAWIIDNKPLFNKPTTMKFTKYDRLWDLMIYPVTDNRYDPHKFHINMWNEWTGDVCRDHNH